MSFLTPGNWPNWPNVNTPCCSYNQEDQSAVCDSRMICSAQVIGEQPPYSTVWQCDTNLSCTAGGGQQSYQATVSSQGEKVVWTPVQPGGGRANATTITRAKKIPL